MPEVRVARRRRTIARNMKRTQQLGPGATHLIGLVFVVAGILPMLAAFDIGPQAPLAGGLFGVLALAGLAAIGNWVAFGPGPRACSGSISLSWLWGAADFSGLACRISFGLGALITDAFLCWMIVSLLQKALGGPPRLARLLKAAEWLIMASLVPILLPLLLFLVAGAALGAIRTRRTTGAWSRNEEFIVRQKARGLLERFGRKPPPDEMK